jgi:hypothetical protein
VPPHQFPERGRALPLDECPDHLPIGLFDTGGSCGQRAGQNPRRPNGSNRRHVPSSCRVGPSVRTPYSASGPKSIRDFLAPVATVRRPVVGTAPTGSVEGLIVFPVFLPGGRAGRDV